MKTEDWLSSASTAERLAFIEALGRATINDRKPNVLAGLKSWASQGRRDCRRISKGRMSVGSDDEVRSRRQRSLK